MDFDNEKKCVIESSFIGWLHFPIINDFPFLFYHYLLISSIKKKVK